MPTTENINWDLITSSIRSQRTILFIGEELTLNYHKENNEQKFLQEFVKNAQDDILSFHEKDGFLVFKDESAKLMHLHKLKKFYQKDFKNPILEKLAEIPFHLIISVMPDLTLNKIFKEKNFAFQQDYYRAKKNIQDLAPITAEKPLLYQLLGSVADEESLITSHYDLFNMMEAIYKDQNLPNELLSAFNKEKTRNIIFLGFDFEKWYFQMLLHLLKINFDPCIRYAASTENNTSEWQTFYEAQFKINFISSNITEFVEKLHQEFQPNELRQAAENSAQKRNYKKDNILKFLSKSFNAGDFETFCFIHFEQVKDEFNSEMGQTTRLRKLLEYAEQHQAFETLLELAKEENPVQYKNFEPYYEEVE
jgi:hypothetical protein